MTIAINQGEYIVGLRLFHIQPLGSSLFCERRRNQAIGTDRIALVKFHYKKYQQYCIQFMQPSELTGTMCAFQQLFADWGSYIASIPTYAGGPMAFGWGSDSSKARDVDVAVLTKCLEAAGLDLDYYTHRFIKPLSACRAISKSYCPNADCTA